MAIVVAIANLIVGTIIGISGVSGFLLPIIYAGLLSLTVADSLTLSFASFLTYGVIGTYAYWKSGDIIKRYAVYLAISSIAGALVGVKLSTYIPTNYAKVILYIVVLLSGISLLLQRFRKGKKGTVQSPLLNYPVFVLAIGFLISFVCTIAGAGGPIIMLPLLTCLGMNLRAAVGLSMFESIFIALPAFVGYYSHTTLLDINTLVLISIVFQAAGFLVGTKAARKINADILKVLVACIAVGISCYTLFNIIAG